MSHKTTILLADDHPLILEGNRAYLASAGFEIVALAKDGNDAYNKIIRHNPDIAVLDMQMPVLTGLESAKAIHQKKLPIYIIILSLHLSQEIYEAVGKYIHGYILKEDALEEILKCIETVLEGKTYVSKKITSGFTFADSNKLSNLTPSEYKILQYIAKRMTSHEIAETLFLSPRTVEKHRENIIKKLRLNNIPNALQLWVSENKTLFE